MTKQENNDNRHRPNIPPLRFRGFTDPWQRKQLGEIGQFKSNGVDKTINQEDQQINLLNYMDVYTQRIVTAENCGALMQVTAKQRQLRENNILAGDVFFTPSSETPEDIGRVTVIEEDLPNTCYSYHLMRYRPSEGVFFKLFPKYAFSGMEMRRQLVFEAQGVQRFVLSKENFENLTATFPSLAEQEKIGSFFRALDELIAAREAELEKLRQMKAALLDAMFPSDAPVERVARATAHTLYDSLLDHTLQAWDIVPTETSTPHTPRLRFRGFTDPWQRTQLGNVFHLKTDRVDLHDLSTVRYISTEDMLQDFQGVTSSSNPPMSYSVVRFSKGDILMANIRPYLKKVWLADSEGGCSTDVIVFSPKDSHNSRFLYHELANDRFIEYVMDGAQGIKMPRGNKETMKDYTLYVPSLAEQKQIGAFFRSQDEGIATATEQIDKLKRIKQACLKQMFV